MRAKGLVEKKPSLYAAEAPRKYGTRTAMNSLVREKPSQRLRREPNSGHTSVLITKPTAMRMVVSVKTLTVIMIAGAYMGMSS